MEAYHIGLEIKRNTKIGGIKTKRYSPCANIQGRQQDGSNHSNLP